MGAVQALAGYSRQWEGCMEVLRFQKRTEGIHRRSKMKGRGRTGRGAALARSVKFFS